VWYILYIGIREKSMTERGKEMMRERIDRVAKIERGKD
jgi:hypothetical protein